MAAQIQNATTCKPRPKSASNNDQKSNKCSPENSKENRNNDDKPASKSKSTNNQTIYSTENANFTKESNSGETTPPTGRTTPRRPPPTAESIIFEKLRDIEPGIIIGVTESKPIVERKSIAKSGTAPEADTVIESFKSKSYKSTTSEQNTKQENNSAINRRGRPGNAVNSNLHNHKTTLFGEVLFAESFCETEEIGNERGKNKAINSERKREKRPENPTGPAAREYFNAFEFIKSPEQAHQQSIEYYNGKKTKYDTYQFGYNNDANNNLYHHDGDTVAWKRVPGHEWSTANCRS